MAIAETIRRRIHDLEPQRSVFAIVPLQQQLDDAYAENRLRTILLASFAATAVLLACIGLYGTLNYLGRLRQREMGYGWRWAPSGGRSSDISLRWGCGSRCWVQSLD
jgi:putative ABC transport system permease protein